MVFSGALQNIARERAALLRDIEYIRENVNDAKLQEAILIYEACEKDHKIYSEDAIMSAEESAELDAVIDKIPDTDESEGEIDRILAYQGDDMSIDDVMGIDTPEGDSEAFVEQLARCAECTKECGGELCECGDGFKYDKEC